MNCFILIDILFLKYQKLLLLLIINAFFLIVKGFIDMMFFINAKKTFDAHKIKKIKVFSKFSENQKKYSPYVFIAKRSQKLVEER